MTDKNQNNQQAPAGKQKKEGEMEQGEGGNTFFEKWKDPAENKMGNDISSEIKIANSGGAREEGYDKKWHMEEDSEKGDEELRQG